MQRGSGGYAPCKPIFSSFHLEEIWGNGACEGTQAVLAVSDMEKRLDSLVDGNEVEF